MASVSLERVTKYYGRRRRRVVAVRDLTLLAANREFVVLVGPSGCGKTTTLRLVAGLEDVSAGAVWIGGSPVNDVTPRDRDVAMVFQDHALYPHMNVRGNMTFGLKMRNVPRAEIRERVQRTASMLGIEPLLDRKPRELSGGERQRVAVGRALVREPRVFLFDEPLSNLDAQLRVQMRREIKRLHQRVRTTVLYVTHDQEEAMALGDRIVVMKDGVLQQCGRPLEVYERPVNRFVARFVGTPAMNFLDGRVVSRNGQVVFETASGAIELPPAIGRRLAEHSRRDLVLGVRPESLRLDPARQRGSASPGRWPMRVQFAEPLGEAQDVYLRTPGGQQVVARVSARVEVAEGSAVDVLLDSARVHLFEPGESGRNLGLGGYGGPSSAN